MSEHVEHKRNRLKALTVTAFGAAALGAGIGVVVEGYESFSHLSHSDKVVSEHYNLELVDSRSYAQDFFDRKDAAGAEAVRGVIELGTAVGLVALAGGMGTAAYWEYDS